MEIRLPVPFQPVLTRYAFAPLFFHLLDELFGVLGRMQLEEGLAEAGGEGRGGLGDAALGAGQLRGEAGQEVVLGLLRRQDGDGGRTPKASADRKMTFFAAGAEETGRTIFSMWSMG